MPSAATTSVANACAVSVRPFPISFPVFFILTFSRGRAVLA